MSQDATLRRLPAALGCLLLILLPGVSSTLQAGPGTLTVTATKDTFVSAEHPLTALGGESLAYNLHSAGSC